MVSFNSGQELSSLLKKGTEHASPFGTTELQQLVDRNLEAVIGPLSDPRERWWWLMQ